MGLSATFASTWRQPGAILRTSICSALLLLLTSCRIPCLPHAQPGQPLPPDFSGAMSAESSAQLGVDEFFEDPLLTSMIAQALGGNQELKILEQEVQIASNEVLGRRGAYFPFITVGGDAGLERHSLYTPLGTAERELEFAPGKGFPDPLPSFRLGAGLLWQLDIWRELRNARDAAALRYIAAMEKRDYFVTQMVAEIANNYFELMALDQRLQILDRIIDLQEHNVSIAVAKREAGRDTDLPVQRFQAEVQKNQSERLIVIQEIVETENRINFLRGAYPQRVQRDPEDFVERNLSVLNVGMPAQLLQYRTDIRQAERELAASGLDVRVARARFFPRLDLAASVGFEAFHPKYLFTPEAVIGNVAGELVGPLINRAAIRADYLSANARQLQAVYNYQRVVLNAFTEVVNNLAKAENYRQSVELKKAQLATLESAVDVANQLFMTDRADYADVLFTQRDLLDARTLLVETKQQQWSAIVNAYQALGGGVRLANSTNNPIPFDLAPLGSDAGSSEFLPAPPFSPLPADQHADPSASLPAPAREPPTVSGDGDAEELSAPPAIQEPPTP